MVDLPSLPRIPVNTRVEVRKRLKGFAKGEAVEITKTENAAGTKSRYTRGDRGIILGQVTLTLALTLT